MQQQPSPASSLPTARPKQKNIPVGITAGAEDIKYQTKYKDLKRKVHDIEADNDKTYFKILQATRNIKRMKLERAILYERLAAVPPSPPPSTHHSLSAPTPPIGSRHTRLEVEEYARPPRQSENRGPILETPIGHDAIPSHRASRRMEDPIRESSRPHLHHPMDVPRSQAPSSHEHPRPHMPSRSRQQQQFQQQYPDGLPPMSRGSPPPERGRIRRMDINELAGPDHHSHSRHQPRHLSPSAMGDTRASRQQSVPRPVYGERDEYLERERDHRLRDTNRPYGDQVSASRTRDDVSHPHDTHNRHLYVSPRAGSPSPSGGIPSDVPSRPDSRSQAYDRSYSLRGAPHDEREEMASRDRLMTFPPPREGPPPQATYSGQPRDWERIDDVRRAPPPPDGAMDIDSRHHRRAQDSYPESRRYYDSERSPTEHHPRGFRPSHSQSPEDEDRRMDM